jgi:predicted HicB family RNase H-like nuclease
MPAEKTEQVMVRMSPELLRELRLRAQNEERSVAQTVRLAIRGYLSGWTAPLPTGQPDQGSV